MGTLQDCIFLGFKVIQACLLHYLVTPDELSHWRQNVLWYVLNHSIYERRANVFDLALDPLVVVQEISLASQNSKINCKVIVMAVDYRKQALSYLLSDVKHSAQVHEPLVVLAQLANTSDEQFFVVVE